VCSRVRWSPHRSTRPRAGRRERDRRGRAAGEAGGAVSPVPIRGRRRDPAAPCPAVVDDRTSLTRADALSVVPRSCPLTQPEDADRLRRAGVYGDRRADPW
jgi:hypothetical protein